PATVSQTRRGGRDDLPALRFGNALLHSPDASALCFSAGRGLYPPAVPARAGTKLSPSARASSSSIGPRRSQLTLIFSTSRAVSRTGVALFPALVLVASRSRSASAISWSDCARGASVPASTSFSRRAQSLSRFARV